MLRFSTFSSEMRAAYPYYKAISPKFYSALVGKPATAAKIAVMGWRARKALKRNDTVQEAAVDFTSDVIKRRMVGFAMKPVSNLVLRGHRVVEFAPRKDFSRKNGLGGRYWYHKPSRERMVIVFHDANRAGPHIDVHLGRLSVVYKVKPDLYGQLRYNNEGMLTEASRKLITDHVRSEILNGSRVPQNLDHSVTARRSSWTGGDPHARHYGAGRTRQVVAEADVDILKAHICGPIEMYAPSLWPHRSLYMYRLYPGDGSRAPILIWGAKSHHPPELEDRLHLKMIPPEVLEADQLYMHADPETSTAKYDGSSAYVVITPKGTTVWSPRISKTTGEQIEYTGTLGDLSQATSPVTVVGMGEVLFKSESRWPWQRDEYLPQAAGSGILNANDVLPRGIVPEIRLYRVDKVGRQLLTDQDFWENREVQHEMAALAPDILKVVELMDHRRALLEGFEGIVAVPIGKSVHHGIKSKYWQDPHDWQIDDINLQPGPKGGVAGVVWFTSLESNKRFKLGPSNLGNREMQLAMMENPQDYVGTVVKVRSRHGHEGRASKVLGFHDDKGLSPT